MWQAVSQSEMRPAGHPRVTCVSSPRRKEAADDDGGGDAFGLSPHCRAAAAGGGAVGFGISRPGCSHRAPCPPGGSRSIAAPNRDAARDALAWRQSIRSWTGHSETRGRLLRFIPRPPFQTLIRFCFCLRAQKYVSARLISEALLTKTERSSPLEMSFEQ